MAQPTPYNKSRTFADSSTGVKYPVPASFLDTEFSLVERTVDEICANLELIQRDDGKLANGSVHSEALSADVQAMIGNWTPRATWLTDTQYAAKDMVTFEGRNYVAVIAHTSGVFSADFAVGKWQVLTDVASMFGGVEISVPTVAALRAYQGPATTAVVVAGATFNDGVGGNFAVKVGDGATADDGTNVIVDVRGRRWWRVSSQRTDSLPDMAALRLYRGPAAYVTLASRVEFGDGGGGLFAIKNGDTTSADDGAMTVVDPLGRRWRRVFDGAYNALWWGKFVGSAVQGAINYVAANHADGAEIFIPDGHWALDSTLSITSPGVRLRGGSMRGTVLVDTFASGHSVEATGQPGHGTDNFEISNLTFWANVPKAPGSAALHLNNVHFATARMLRNNSNHYNAVRITGGAYSYINQIDTCDFGNNQSDAIVIGSGGALVQGVVLNDVQIHYAGGAGIALFSCSGISARNVSIAGCRDGIVTFPFGATRTGDTHGSVGTPSGLIDNINTSGLNTGMIISGSGVFGQIVAVTANSITISPPLQSTASGVSFYCYNFVVAGQWDSCVVDTCTFYGLKLWTGGGIVAGHVFNNQWACSNGAGDRTASGANRHGVSVIPGSDANSRVVGLSFSNPIVANNTGSGFSFEVSNGSIHHVGISSPNIGQNSVAGSGFQAGIDIGDGVSNVSIVGGFSGPGHILNTVANLQNYGIRLIGTSGDHISIDAVDCTGNVTGAVLNQRTTADVKIDARGYTNVKRGTGSISGATSVVVAHGLSETPTLSGIDVRPTGDPGSGIRSWVSAVGASNFTLTTSAAATYAFAWEARGPTAP
jgi:hypothetical protein